MATTARASDGDEREARRQRGAGPGGAGVRAHRLHDPRREALLGQLGGVVPDGNLPHVRVHGDGRVLVQREERHTRRHLPAQSQSQSLSQSQSQSQWSSACTAPPSGPPLDPLWTRRFAKGQQPGNPATRLGPQQGNAAHNELRAVAEACEGETKRSDTGVTPVWHKIDTGATQEQHRSNTRVTPVSHRSETGVRQE
eukprot:3883198-Pyramimonas_sp.AAC.1